MKQNIKSGNKPQVGYALSKAGVNPEIVEYSSAVTFELLRDVYIFGKEVLFLPKMLIF